MDRLEAQSISPDVQLRPQAQPSAETGQAAKAAEQRQTQHGTAPNGDVASKELHVVLDRSAARFVQTLTDNQTDETLRRFPSEAQLAYSRAVMAYMRALRDAVSGRES